MADFRSRQRVQIHDGTNEFAVTAGQPIFVSLSDGTDTALIDASGNLQAILAANDGVDIGDVTINNTSLTVTATDLDIRDLSVSQDSIRVYANTAKDGSGTNYIPLVDADGHLQVDVLSGGGSNASVLVDDAAFTVATDSITAVGALADETTPDSVNEGDVGALRMTLDRKLLVRVVGATDGNRMDVDASGNAKAILAANDGVDIGDVTINNASIAVTATDLDIRDLTSVTDSVSVLQSTHDNLNANANLQVGDADVSATNPVPVNIVDQVSSAEVNDYNTTAALAKDASANHDYTVTASTTLLVKSIIISASGAVKFELLTGPLASLATKVVGFTSGSKLVEQIDFPKPIEVPDTSTGTARITIRNDDNQAMDVYSTLIGEEV